MELLFPEPNSHRFNQTKQNAFHRASEVVSFGPHVEPASGEKGLWLDLPRGVQCISVGASVGECLEGAGGSVNLKASRGYKAARQHS